MEQLETQQCLNSMMTMMRQHNSNSNTPDLSLWRPL